MRVQKRSSPLIFVFIQGRIERKVGVERSVVVYASSTPRVLCACIAMFTSPGQPAFCVSPPHSPSFSDHRWRCICGAVCPPAAIVGDAHQPGRRRRSERSAVLRGSASPQGVGLRGGSNKQATNAPRSLLPHVLSHLHTRVFTQGVWSWVFTKVEHTVCQRPASTCRILPLFQGRRCGHFSCFTAWSWKNRVFSCSPASASLFRAQELQRRDTYPRLAFSGTSGLHCLRMDRLCDCVCSSPNYCTIARVETIQELREKPPRSFTRNGVPPSPFSLFANASNLGI